MYAVDYYVGGSEVHRIVCHIATEARYGKHD